MQQQGIKIYTQDTDQSSHYPPTYAMVTQEVSSHQVTQRQFWMHYSYILCMVPIYFNLIILIFDEEYDAHFYVTYFTQTNFFNSTSQITDVCILMFPLFIRKLANKDSPLNGTHHSPKCDLLLISSWLYTDLNIRT